MITENGEIYRGISLNPDSKERLKFRLENRYLTVVFLVICECNWTFFVMHKIKRFREKNCECDSYHISLFYICWSVVTRGCVFSAVLSTLLSNYSCQKTWIADFPYKSLKLGKIDNIDLTQHFSLSIFTDFRYHSIKITWLLSIFIDTDFYWLNWIRDEINFVVCLFVCLIGIIFFWFSRC